MKKFTTMLLALMFAVTMQAQKDVTTFLGIPVDGFKSEMRKKLIAKGFTPVQGDDYLDGEFNGTEVSVLSVTNNNKVYRIMLMDKYPQDEANIKIRFNNLVSQFSNNQHYMVSKDYTIAKSEDISYEMLVHNKIYSAGYFQNPDMSKVDTLSLTKASRDKLLTKFTEEELKNPTEELKSKINKELDAITFDIISKKKVWFKIINSYDGYRICMYYDNEYNHANGEDL